MARRTCQRELRHGAAEQRHFTADGRQEQVRRTGGNRRSGSPNPHHTTSPMFPDLRRWLAFSRQLSLMRSAGGGSSLYTETGAAPFTFSCRHSFAYRKHSFAVWAWRVVYGIALPEIGAVEQIIFPHVVRCS